MESCQPPCSKSPADVEVECDDGVTFVDEKLQMEVHASRGADNVRADTAADRPRPTPKRKVPSKRGPHPLQCPPHMVSNFHDMYWQFAHADHKSGLL